MKLIVAEKHSVGENIAKIVGASQKKSGYSEGNGYVVTWCVGHLVGLSLPDKYGEKYENYWTFDNLPIIPSDWKFELNKETAHQFKVVKDLMSRNDIEEIVCATDAEREGECIFRYVYNYAKCQKPVLRLWISSMEDKPVEIAEYKGFKVTSSYSSFSNLYKGEIKGSNIYPFDFGTSSSGNLTRIDNTIASVSMRMDGACK